jgi:hypothetical protein
MQSWEFLWAKSYGLFEVVGSILGGVVWTLGKVGRKVENGVASQNYREVALAGSYLFGTLFLLENK